jgi:serine phosphatase RsbU (regulator of sigma subunit)
LTRYRFWVIMGWMSREPSFRNWHISNVTILVAGIVAILASWPYYPVREPIQVFLFSLLAVAANLSLIPFGSGSLLTLVDAAFLAASMTLGPPAAGFVIVTAVTAGTINRRPPPERSTWLRRFSSTVRNYGTYMLMIAAASWVYDRLGGQVPLEHLDISNYIAGVGFIITYQLVNRLLLYHGLYLRGNALRQEVQTEPEVFSLELASLHLGLLIAVAYAYTGMGSLVIFGAFIFLVSFFMLRYVSQLQRRVTQLGALNEIGRTLSATLDISSLAEAVYRESSKVIDTTNFYIALYEAEHDQVTFILDVEEGQRCPQTTRQGGEGLTEHVIRTCSPLLLTDDVTPGAHALGVEPTDRPAQCWLGVPMIASDRVVGMIAAQSFDRPRVFTQEHVDVLMTVAAQAAIAIENAHLLEEMAEKERMRQELELARTIQQNLLPPSPVIPGLFIAGYCLPAQETGGDLFDFIEVSDTHLGIVIGDVVGKGMPAALLMTTARSMLRSHAQYQSDPAAVLRAVNSAIYADTRGKTYVTLCYVVLDLQHWTLTWASAGHLYPLLCSSDTEPVYLEGPGYLPLGIQPELAYNSQVKALSPGQTVVLYTDGVVEAHDAGRQMFGFEALRSLVAGLAGEQLIDTIVERITQFTGPTPQQDDLTLVVLQRVDKEQA